MHVPVKIYNQADFDTFEQQKKAKPLVKPDKIAIRVLDPLVMTILNTTFNGALLKRKIIPGARLNLLVHFVSSHSSECII